MTIKQSVFIAKQFRDYVREYRPDDAVFVSLKSEAKYIRSRPVEILAILEHEIMDALCAKNRNEMQFDILQELIHLMKNPSDVMYYEYGEYKTVREFCERRNANT